MASQGGGRPGRDRSMPRVRSIRILALVAFVAFVAASLLPAAGRGGVEPNLTVTPSSGVVGATLTANATGFPTGSITFWWDNTQLLGTPQPVVSGGASVSFKIPAGAIPGSHFVRACGGSFCPNGTPQPHADDTVTVVLVATTPRPTRPPSTPKPTPAPTPRPTPRPTPTLDPSSGPSPAPSSTPAPTASGGVAIPNPSFPLTGPSPAPSLPSYVAITPPPQPPSNEGAPETAWPNLWVAGLEVTQGIQNVDNDMPLVAGRRTYARVYIDLNGAESWPQTWGALEARRGGQQIGWIWPDNGPIVARQGGGDRTRLDDSLYFRLPASWLSGGVTLTTFIFSYGIDTPFTKESSALDNTWQESVYFNEALPLTLHLAPLHMHRSWHPTDVERTFLLPDLGDVLAPGADLNAIGTTNRVVAGAYRYLPIAQLNLDALNAPVYPLNHFNGHEFDLGGPCRSTVVEIINFARFVIADWTILMKDPSEVTPDADAFMAADREELRILDRTYTVINFAARPDGTGEVYANHDANGPAPVIGAPVYAYGCSQIVGEDAEPNHAMGLYRVFYDWQEEREMFVGMVHPSLRAQWGGFSTPSTDSVWVRWLDEYGDGDPWRHRGAGILGHEAVHSAGLGHVPCKDDNGDGVPDEAGDWFDLTHPMTLTFPDCWLSEVDPDGYYGFDTTWDLFGLPGPTVLSNDPAQALPNRAFPLLSYELPAWIDPYHYCRLLAYYGVPCSATELDLPWNVPPPEPDGSDPFAAITPPPAPLEDGVHAMTISYTGLEDDTWTLDVLARNPNPTANDVERIAAERRAKPDPERNWIVVLDAAGGVRWQAILPAPVNPHEAEGGATTGDAVVPVWPDTSAIEIRGWDGTTKARIAATEGQPDIAGLFKDTADGETVEPDDEILISFEAGDPGDGRLRFFLLYSPDREHWQFVGATEDERRIPVPVGDLPSGPDPAFRLVAFDGWSIDEETLPVPELGGPRNPPQIWILTQRFSSYPRWGAVRLEAAAFDAEDRDLPGEAIRWSSSIDGDLGTGTELLTRALSPGLHVITAVATDSDGLEASATREVVIDGAVQAPLPGEALQAGMAGIFDRLGAGLDPAPSDVDHPDFIWLPVGVAAVALLLVVVAFGAGRYVRTGRQSSAATVGAAQAVSVGAAQAPKPAEPDLLAHEAAHTHQGDDASAADTASTWTETGDLAQPGSMTPGPGHHGSGINEMAMDDTAGKEE